MGATNGGLCVCMLFVRMFLVCVCIAVSVPMSVGIFLWSQKVCNLTWTSSQLHSCPRHRRCTELTVGMKTTAEPIYIPEQSILVEQTDVEELAAYDPWHVTPFLLRVPC